MSPTSVHGGGWGVFVFVLPFRAGKLLWKHLQIFSGFSQTCKTSSFGVPFKFYGKNIAGY